MTNHISFDDIEKCVYMEDITPDNMRLLHRVQSHLLKCSECRDVYDKMLRVKQVQDDIDAGIIPEGYVAKKSEESKNAIVNVAARLIVTVEKGIRLTLDSIDNVLDTLEYNFDHPMALASRSGRAAESETILVDEENDYNRLSIDTDGLTVTLDAEDWDGIVPVLELKTLDGKVFSVEMAKQDDRYTAQLPIDVSGRYEISIGCKE